MANSIINANGISVGNDGKIKISGFSSNIDSKAIIDAQVAARRQPAVRLETKITNNNTLVSAYKELKGFTASLTSSLDKLRSAPGSSVDVFNNKTASGTTVAATGAPSGFVPSDINSLLLTSIGPTAQNGTHTIKIQQVAKAQQIRGDALSSTSASLSSLGIPTGSFTLNGKTITVSATDTLQDLRAAINTAGAGVNATIVSASATTNYLVLTSSQTGVANQVTFGGSNSIPAALGLTTGAGAIKTQLTAAQDAILDVNGVTGITRSTNAVSDVLTGVTLNLLKAEPNTEITLKIEPDLNSIKTALADFVKAYNDLRDYYNNQRTAADRNDDGKVDDNELGPLAYDQRLRDIVGRMGLLVSNTMDANADGFRSLGQLGITMGADYKLQVNDATLDNRLLSNVGEVRKLFGFTSSTNDSRLTVVNRTAKTQSGTYYLNLAGTDAGGNITSANFRTTVGSGAGGTNDGTAVYAGQSITSRLGNSEGLNVFFAGAASLGPVNDISITIQRGIADQFYDFFNDQSRAGIGSLDTAISQINQQNTDYTDRIEVIDTRLTVLRQTLEAKFVRMETALSQLENLRNTIQNYINSNNQGN
jgi:flagellar hook-associated protein 2